MLSRLYRKLLLRYGSEETKTKVCRAMGVRIGERCRLYSTNFGPEPWLIKLGDHVGISNDVTFVTHNLTHVFRDTHEQLTSFGSIEVRDNCVIGVGATILPNVVIGPNSVIGAGSVVTKTVPPNTVVAGNPARVICTLEEYEKKCVDRHIQIPLDREAARRVLEKHFWGDDA
ncbi:MAG: acyltransferase [bacterium]|nr:acyltransferase [bacterium]